MKIPTLFILLSAAIFLASFPLTASQAADPQIFWNDYPPCEEQCHESVWAAQKCSLPNTCGCTTSSGSGSCLCLADSCLCETSSWLIAVAQCIGKTCGAGDATTAASIAASACSGNGFRLAVASTALVSYGMAAIPTTTSISKCYSLTENGTPKLRTTGPTSTQSSGTEIGTGTGTGTGSQPNPIIAAYVVPIGICVVTIIFMLIIWIFNPDEAKALLRKCCCCL